MKVTVTNHIQQSTKSGYSATVSHNRHDPNVKHTNHDINFDLRQYNYLNQGKDRREELEAWQENKFGSWIEEHDRLQREKGHGERQYGSVQAWIKKQNQPIGVLTVGSLESTNSLMRKVIPEDLLTTRELPNGAEKVLIKTDTPAGKEAAKKFYGVYRDAYKYFVYASNKMLDNVHDAGQHIGRYAVHCDELGAPHLHYELAAYSFTAKGKGSGSFDRAMRQMTGKSGKAAMAYYRKNMDGKIALECFNRVLHKAYGEDVTLELTRKTLEDPTTKTGLSMEQVKAIHAEEAKAKAAADKLKAEISAKEAEKNQLTTEVEEKKGQVKGLNDQITAKTSEVEAKTAEAGELDKTIKHHKARKKKVETEIENLEAEADRQDKALTEAEESHKAVMSWWASEKEDAKRDHDNILAENHKQEELKKQLSADLEAMKTAVDQQKGLFDQITTNLKQWVEKHLKDLINLGLNREFGSQWVQEQGNTYTANEWYKADQADDIDRLAAGEEVPRRYVRNTELRKWVRFNKLRQQRNLRERTGAGGTDYSKRDDGPDL